MASPPPSKRAKLVDESTVESLINDVEQLQAELEQINDEASEKILEIEREYNRKRRPKYEARGKLCQSIPGFWVRVLTNSAVIQQLMTDEDTEALSYLEEDFDDIKSGYKIVFRFAENPFFSDAVLEKTFSFDEEGALSVRSTMPSWKPGKCLTGDADAGEDTAELRKQAINQGEWVSFFDWFRSDDATTQEDENNNNNGQTGDIVARVIKEEIWPDPEDAYVEELGEDGYGEEEGEEGEEGYDQGEEEEEGLEEDEEGFEEGQQFDGDAYEDYEEGDDDDTGAAGDDEEQQA